MKKYLYDITLTDDTAPAKILRLIEPNKAVLEIGCASGTQTQILKEQFGCTVTGIELDPDAAETARKYCDRLIVGNIEHLSLKEHLPRAQYDIIMFADVLEHLYDPGKVLNNIKEALSDDGYILASIPNVVHESIIFEILNGRFDYQKYGLLDNTHIRFFTRKTIYQLFEQAGFVISYIDRVICSDCDTEFNKINRTEKDRKILDYVRERNPDSETFQFIVKAYKAREGARGVYSELIAAQEKISDLQKSMKEKDSKIGTLESNMKWMENRLPYSFIKKLRGVFGNTR